MSGELKLIRYGKYHAVDKLDRLCRFWETGDAGLPQEDRVDWHGRDTISHWQSWALSAARRSLYEYIHGFDAGPPPTDGSEIGRLVKQNNRSVYDLPGVLEAAVPHGGFRAIASLPELSAEATAEAVAVFRAGMLNGLLYTNDAGEVPELHMLADIAGPFPVSHLAGMTSAACFFTNAYLGCQDVIHVYASGIPQVTLVDIDGPRTELMKLIYPSHWSYVVADFRDFLRHSAARGAKYDLVVSDPELSLAADVINEVGDFIALTGKILCLLYTGDALARDGYDAGGVEGLSDTLSARAGIRLEVLEVMHRNTIARRNLSIYWAVIRVV